MDQDDDATHKLEEIEFNKVDLGMVTMDWNKRNVDVMKSLNATHTASPSHGVGSDLPRFTHPIRSTWILWATIRKQLVKNTDGSTPLQKKLTFLGYQEKWQAGFAYEMNRDVQQIQGQTLTCTLIHTIDDCPIVTQP